MKRRSFLVGLTASAASLLLPRLPRHEEPQSLIPTGYISPYAREIPPKGWLLCNGAILSRRKYPELYELFKSNPGSTSWSFALPDLCGRVATGSVNTGIEPHVSFSYIIKT